MEHEALLAHTDSQFIINCLMFIKKTVTIPLSGI